MKFKDYIKLGMGAYIGWTVMKCVDVAISKFIDDTTKDKSKED